MNRRRWGESRPYFLRAANPVRGPNGGALLSHRSWEDEGVYGGGVAGGGGAETAGEDGGVVGVISVQTLINCLFRGYRGPQRDPVSQQRAMRNQEVASLSPRRLRKPRRSLMCPPPSILLHTLLVLHHLRGPASQSFNCPRKREIKGKVSPAVVSGKLKGK